VSRNDSDGYIDHVSGSNVDSSSSGTNQTIEIAYIIDNANHYFFEWVFNINKMVNMGVQYIFALVLSVALGVGLVKSNKVKSSGGLVGVAEALCLVCSSLFLTMLVFPLYTLFSCYYKSPGLWMVAILASTIAACNVPSIPIDIKTNLIPIAIVLQIIGLFMLQCNKKLTYSNVTKN